MKGWQGRIPLFIGIVGHRSFRAEQLPAIEQAVRRVLGELRRQLPATPIAVLSQLAEGADQLVTNLALAEGFESACILPLELERYRGRFSTPAARAQFDRLLALGEMIELPETHHVGDDRSRGYAAAGHYLARHATLVVALWDGLDSAVPGSTADVVRYRLATSMTPGGAGVLHLSVARDDGAAYVPAPTFRLLPAEAGSHPVTDPGALVAKALAAADWQQAEEFNDEAQRLHTVSPAATPEPFAALDEPHLDEVARQYATASTLARRAQGRVRRWLVWLHVLALLSGLAFLQILTPDGEKVWVWVYLALLGTVMVLRKLLQHTALKQRHLDYRCLAESLRVTLYWRLAGVHGETGPNAAALRLVGRSDAALRWIGHAILGIDGWLGATRTDASVDGCEFAARYWIGTPNDSDPNAQLSYYRAAASRARRVARWTQRVSNAALWSGIAATAALALTPHALVGVARPVLATLMGLLPLASSTASSVVDVNAEQELARQYDAIAAVLERAAERLRRADGTAEKRQVLFDVGTAVLVEQRIWHTILHERTA